MLEICRMGSSIHSFHIPVMGLAFTIDSPIKVARYGISSVISIIDDVLIEDMRKYYSKEFGLDYEPIKEFDDDFRARRITAYLDLVHDEVNRQFDILKNESLDTESDLTKYLDMLDDRSSIKMLYHKYRETKNENEKRMLSKSIREAIKPGSIDVNVMSKIDPPAHTKKGELLPPEYSAAVAALRGFAKSKLNSSVVLSAGFNPRLYGFLDKLDDFFPDEEGEMKKRVILKVSDFRSARIQGQYLAKRGIFVSEFRIESGLNCGGHAFPTEGYLLGPILQEFKSNRKQLSVELSDLCAKAWTEKGLNVHGLIPEVRVTVQGGIGTANENRFLLDHYEVNSTGWGTPFLLVPEATNLDAETLEALAHATPDQLFLSQSSPLGVPFNNFSMSASELQRKDRIAHNKPGSPCLKKFLVSNTEFSKDPICTASKQYIHHKLQALEAGNLPKEEYDIQYETVTAKECLCEDLAAPAYINGHIKTRLKQFTAVCPGPNLPFFTGKFTLKQMVDHIYGRINLLNNTYRPNMFLNELKLYIDYIAKEIKKHFKALSPKQINFFSSFIKNLQDGIQYYKELIPLMKIETAEYLKRMQEDLASLEVSLLEIRLPELVLA